MRFPRYLFLLLAWVLLAGCESTPVETAADHPSPPGKPALIALLPPQIGRFYYVGFHEYPHASLGYSIRYQIDGIGYADVYLYPVPDQVRNLAHEDVVRGMAGAALKEIEYYAAEGVYANFAVLTQGLMTIADDLTARVDGTYIRDNLNLYTLLYLTEHEATLLKVRMTLVDNPQNRQSTEWDGFVQDLFHFVVAHIEKV